jgi:hypothetical protein
LCYLALIVLGKLYVLENISALEIDGEKTFQDLQLVCAGDGFIDSLDQQWN